MRRRDRYPLGITATYERATSRGVGRHHQVVGYVYFARHHPIGHYIKIGWAVDPTERLRTWLLEIIAVVPGTRYDEDAIQNRFLHLHYEGEWFEPADELLSYIEAIRRA